MKKIRILVFIFILAFSFNVKAEVLLEIDCNDKNISDNKSVTCEGNLLYEKEGITDIDLNYDTNLDINFIAADGFTLTKTNNKITIHTDNPLYDELMNCTKIMEFTLSSNDKVSEKEKLIINNILINKSNTIKVDDVFEDFNVTKTIIKQDNVCTLNSITVENEVIKGFNKDKFEYRDIKVTNDVIFIDAIRTSNKSSASGLGNVLVPKGETIQRDILVVAEDGTKNTYKLFITNITPKENKEEVKEIVDEKVKSNDNTLKKLELYNNKKKLDFVFNNRNEVFDINVESDVKKITIKATLNDENASFVNLFGPRDITLDLEDNQVLIKVKAENGDEKIYQLNIHVNKKDSDNSLKLLKINGIEVNLIGDKYEIKLPNNIDKTIIEAIPNNEKAIVKYDDIELALGDNEVKIEVTSEDGQTNEYDINVIREDENILLESISVTGYNLGFTKDKTSYNLKIDKEIDKLDIVINPDDIAYEILNNRDLKDGSKVIVKVTDDDGSYEYTINIEKDTDSSFLDIICYIVFGVGIISLAMSIIYAVKKKK